MKIVIGAAHPGEELVNRLKDAFPDVEFIAAYDEAQQRAAAVDADAFLGSPSRETFLGAKRLRWIHFPGTGIDKIVATQEIVDSDIPVTNAPFWHVRPMADHVLGMALSLAHLAREAFEDQRRKRWDTANYASRIVELHGRVMGLYGLGAIGRAVAQRAVGFGLKVYAVDPSPAEIPGTVTECWDTDRLDDLMRIADWLVVTSPITRETYHAIDRRRIGLMKTGSYVIVISRGGIVDEGALAEALQSGRLAGAGLDATEVEPLPQDSPLWEMSNVILTPHASALSPELYEGRRQVLIENVRRFVAGEPLLNICDKQAGY